MSDTAHVSPDDDASGQASSISIDALADRVYRLMLRDLELERRRAGLPRQRRAGG